LLGFTAMREGTLLLLPRQNFVVADACSGVATLYASLAAAMVLAAISGSHWRRAALILSAPLLAVGANVVRVTLLVLLAQTFGTDLLDTAIHEASGVATFAVALVALLAIANSRAGSDRPAA
jgi:exosortase